MLVPFQLVQAMDYNEACLNSLHRADLERRLKTGRGRKYLTQRLHDWIAAINLSKLERY